MKARVVFDFAEGCFPRNREHQHLATTRDLFDLDRKNDIVLRPENKKKKKKKETKKKKQKKNEVVGEQENTKKNMF